VEISRLGKSIRSVADWSAHAPPKSAKQWKTGRSAYECARAWCGSSAPAVPQELELLLESHRDTRASQIVAVVPEHPVRFDALPGEPRNTDVAVIATRGDETIAISIEAKVDEPFGLYAGDVAADAVDRWTHGERTNALERLETLAATLLPPRAPRGPRLAALRYQLLTATAGAIAYAKEVKATRAVLVVHEFVGKTERYLKQREQNHIDLRRFVTRLSSGAVTDLLPGQLARIGTLPGYRHDAPLYIGRIERDLPVLEEAVIPVSSTGSSTIALPQQP
jgi:hypothetical protein